MTSWQKTIKNIAYALAVLLSITIIGGICSAVASVFYLFDNDSKNSQTQTYSITENISSITIDNSAAVLSIVTGDKFEIVTNNNQLSVKQQNGELTVKDTKRFLSHSDNLNVTIYIPENIVFEKADITTGAGKVNVDALYADRLTLSLGAGEVTVGKMNVTSSACIDGGAGKLTVKNGEISNLDLDMGVGEVSIAAMLKGNSELDYGIGNAKLMLIGNKDDYKISLDKGIGEAIINGEKADTDIIYGTGTSNIDIDGGIGNIEINILEKA